MKVAAQEHRGHYCGQAPQRALKGHRAALQRAADEFHQPGDALLGAPLEAHLKGGAGGVVARNSLSPQRICSRDSEAVRASGWTSWSSLCPAGESVYERLMARGLPGAAHRDLGGARPWTARLVGRVIVVTGSDDAARRWGPGGGAGGARPARGRPSTSGSACWRRWAEAQGAAPALLRRRERPAAGSGGVAGGLPGAAEAEGVVVANNLLSADFFGDQHPGGTAPGAPARGEDNYLPGPAGPAGRAAGGAPGAVPGDGAGRRHPHGPGGHTDQGRGEAPTPGASWRGRGWRLAH